jgi:hypothetical protein
VESSRNITLTPMMQDPGIVDKENESPRDFDFWKQKNVMPSNEKYENK